MFFCSIIATPITIVTMSFLRYYIFAQLALSGIFKKREQIFMARQNNMPEDIKTYKREMRQMVLAFIIVLIYSLYQGIRTFEVIYL